MTRDDYQQLLQALTPRGRAWPRDPVSTFVRFLAALAEEMARFDARAQDLLREMDPRESVELLAEWEDAYGLPDPCVTAEQSMQERRSALLARTAAEGGQSRAYFIAVAAKLGYEVTISEFRPHTCEHDCEHAVYDDEWIFAWQVNAALDTIRERTCEDGVEDALRSWGNDLLECVITRLKPAHTHVIFAYS